MSLIECPECDEEVSDQAPVCPRCGALNPSGSKGRIFLGYMIPVALLVILAGLVFGHSWEPLESWVAPPSRSREGGQAGQISQTRVGPSSPASARQAVAVNPAVLEKLVEQNRQMREGGTPPPRASRQASPPVSSPVPPGKPGEYSVLNTKMKPLTREEKIRILRGEATGPESRPSGR